MHSRGEYKYKLKKPYRMVWLIIVCGWVCFCRKVNKALKDQVDRLWHTTNIYMHPKIHEYGKKLAAKLPGKLKVSLALNVYMYIYIHARTLRICNSYWKCMNLCIYLRG